MEAENPPVLAELLLPGTPEGWVAIGFSVADRAFQVGGVICSVDEKPARWAFSSEIGGSTEIGGIETSLVGKGTDRDAPTEHINQCSKVDHVVIASERPEEIRAKLETLGFVCRGERVASQATDGRYQCFFWSGKVLLELVGHGVSNDADPARAVLWGVTFVVPDFGWVASLSDGILGEPRDAVQQGRQIATVRRDHGLGIEVAFMTPHIKAASR